MADAVIYEDNRRIPDRQLGSDEGMQPTNRPEKSREGENPCVAPEAIQSNQQKIHATEVQRQ